MYLKNKEFTAEIIKSKEQGKLTRDAENMLILLANKTIMKMRYYVPQDREDCLQTGLYLLFKNWDQFDPEKSSNAFAYYTEIFKRAIAKGYGELHYLKGDPERKMRVISIQGINDGEGTINF